MNAKSRLCGAACLTPENERQARALRSRIRFLPFFQLNRFPLQARLGATGGQLKTRKGQTKKWRERSEASCLWARFAFVNKELNSGRMKPRYLCWCRENSTKGRRLWLVRKSGRRWDLGTPLQSNEGRASLYHPLQSRSLPLFAFKSLGKE